MNSVIEKLAEIEATAEGIVERANARKFEVEKEIQGKRDEYDRRLEKETAEKIEAIRRDGEKKMEQILEQERKKNRSAIDKLRDEFAENHTVYAREILKNITEV